MANATQARLPSTVSGALEAIEAHPSVEGIEEVSVEAGVVRAIVLFTPNLPSRAAAAGQSENGVRAQERVTIVFPPDFPQRAPNFYLRKDFPKNLPHIFRHQPGAPVPPCLTVGNPLDVLHSQGMYQLVSQMADWLDKAAIDALTNPEQGWEPSRRTTSAGILVADPDQLVPKNPPWGGCQVYMARGIATSDDTFWQAWAVQLHHGALTPQWLSATLGTRASENGVRSGELPLVLCWPRAVDATGAPINAQYQADTVTTLAQLHARARELGCATALENFVDNFNYHAERARNGTPLDIVIVLPIRRPVHVIGQQTSFEFLTYRLTLDIPGRLRLDSELAVHAMAMLSPVSPPLLQRTSGLPAAERPQRQWTFVGCGSLGSKLVMHMVRAGIRPALLIDGAAMLAHNVARHTLLPADTMTGIGGRKADQMAKIVGSFGMNAPAIFAGDVRYLPTDKDKYRDRLWSQDGLIVNTTASAAVRHFLTNQTFTARVVEAALINQGAGAYLSVEGPERSPSTSDLMYHNFERMRERGLLRDTPSIEDNTLQVGVGCHSVTIKMPDARISLVAAGVGQKLLNLEVNGAPDTGVGAVATVSDDGMSVAWHAEEVGASHLAKVYDSDDWTVRVLANADRQIGEDVLRHPDIETGGLIVGSINALTREIFITSVLPAPADSTRSASRFVLGIDGRAEQIRAYESSASGTLWCLGTWHSHLHPSGPSQMDRDTAALLDGQLRHAAVLLIHHPEGYAALVRSGIPG